MVIIWLMMVNNKLVGGWALPPWKMMEFVSWDDDIPNIRKVIKHVPNHQPVFNLITLNPPENPLTPFKHIYIPWKYMNSGRVTCILHHHDFSPSPQLMRQPRPSAGVHPVGVSVKQGHLEVGSRVRPRHAEKFREIRHQTWEFTSKDM